MENQTRWQLVQAISKRVFKVIGILFLIVVLIIVFFGLQGSKREVKTRVDVAPTSGSFVKAHDIEIFIQEAGPKSGIPILLIHGTGAWSEIWRETMSSLAENGFRAIAIDVPPFGYSEKPNGVALYSREKQAERIIGLLDSLEIEEAVLVGHSVGGRPTTEVALRAPERVKKLILVDPALGFGEEGVLFQQNNPPQPTRMFFGNRLLRNSALSSYGTNPLFTRKLFKSFVSNTDAVTDERVSMLQKPLNIQNTTNAYGDWLAYLVIEKDNSLGSNFENFKKFKMPVSLIWGSTDTVTPLWQGKKLKELIPNSQLRVIEGVGHIPYIENTEQFNEILLEYLKQ